MIAELEARIAKLELNAVAQAKWNRNLAEDYAERFEFCLDMFAILNERIPEGEKKEIAAQMIAKWDALHNQELTEAH